MMTFHETAMDDQIDPAIELLDDAPPPRATYDEAKRYARLVEPALVVVCTCGDAPGSAVGLAVHQERYGPGLQGRKGSRDYLWMERSSAVRLLTDLIPQTIDMEATLQMPAGANEFWMAEVFHGAVRFIRLRPLPESQVCEEMSAPVYVEWTRQNRPYTMP